MDVKKIWEIHKKSLEKVSCVYQRDSGRLGHCYIDPSKPFKVATGTNNYGFIANHLSDVLNPNIHNIKVNVFKQANDVEIYVKPENLWLHKGRVEQIIRTLYAKK